MHSTGMHRLHLESKKFEEFQDVEFKPRKMTLINMEKSKKQGIMMVSKAKKATGNDELPRCFLFVNAYKK